MKVVCDEVFGPVVVIRPYEDIGSVFQWIRDTGLGLNCGIFTGRHDVAFRAVREVPCAAIIVNGTSTFRPDQIPYGGLRNSGYGRESPRDTIMAMTQERILVFPDAR
jgi:acyl-CoA reductase-like NAD-dependent aldehyde dehydrogenase